MILFRIVHDIKFAMTPRGQAAGNRSKYYVMNCIVSAFIFYGCTQNNDVTTGSSLVRSNLESSCVDDEDCPSSMECKQQNGEGICSLVRDACGDQKSCPMGTHCVDDVCVSGCKDNGDCPIDNPCINSVCDEREGICNDNFYCSFGEICNLTTQHCEPHKDAATLCHYCKTRQTTAEVVPCNGNPCVIDNSIAPLKCSGDGECKETGAYCKKNLCETNDDCGSENICGTSADGVKRCVEGFCTRRYCATSACDGNNPCPQGFECNEKITVSDIPCIPGGNSCLEGRQCSASGEGIAVGFCSCIADADCNHKSDSNDDSPKICVNPGPLGYCIAGTTCAPIPGILCSDMFSEETLTTF